MQTKIDCHINYRAIDGTLEIFMVRESINGYEYFVYCKEKIVSKQGALNQKIEPFMEIKGAPYLSQAFLQAMAEALTQYGLYPKEKKLPEGELAAVKYHLEDMRKIVFPGQEKEKKE